MEAISFHLSLSLSGKMFLRASVLFGVLTNQISCVKAFISFDIWNYKVIYQMIAVYQSEEFYFSLFMYYVILICFRCKATKTCWGKGRTTVTGKRISIGRC